MKTIWILARRELRTFFDSLFGYILLVAFLGLAGFFTWLFGDDVFYIGVAGLQQFLFWAFIILFLFVPALTMRMIAEEKKTGTLEVLLTQAVTDWQVVAGKYLACMMLISIALAFTLPYYAAVAWLGPVDHGAVVCGYLGLLLVASTYTGIGLFASSVTHNQIAAFLVALMLGALFAFIFPLLASSISGAWAEAFSLLSLRDHFQSISRGVIDSRDLVFFLSLTAIGMILAEMQLLKRNVVG